MSENNGWDNRVSFATVALAYKERPGLLFVKSRIWNWTMIA